MSIIFEGLWVTLLVHLGPFTILGFFDVFFMCFFFHFAFFQIFQIFKNLKSLQTNDIFCHFGQECSHELHRGSPKTVGRIRGGSRTPRWTPGEHPNSEFHHWGRGGLNMARVCFFALLVSPSGGSPESAGHLFEFFLLGEGMTPASILGSRPQYNSTCWPSLPPHLFCWTSFLALHPTCLLWCHDRGILLFFLAVFLFLSSCLFFEKDTEHMHACIRACMHTSLPTWLPTCLPACLPT